VTEQGTFLGICFLFVGVNTTQKTTKKSNRIGRFVCRLGSDCRKAIR